MKLITTTWHILTIVFLFMLLQACTNHKLTPLERYQMSGLNGIARVVVNYCTMSPETVRSHLKFIFVIDKSGSNQSTGLYSEGPGTDPNGYRRYKPLEQFIENNPVPVWDRRYMPLTTP